MRILAIRGQNLASLSEVFEIDLTADPLSGTGLFAITGDTGAGKSTILDAMCLALYGDYPRASIEKREKVADPSGELIEVSDSRNILTRGAAQGFAEIDFIGQDGIGYRSRWQVRRARNRAAGNLQKADYLLERLDGSGAIATSRRDVLSAVEERSDFTFDEFRRSVLLAQGEFDAFLLADEGKRADLLEKITGTEIYSRISMRVFEDTAERERALEALIQQQTAIGVMPEEEREALLAEQQQKIAERATQADACEQLGQVLKRADDIAKARSGVAIAQSALQEADAAWEAVSAEREHLQRLCIVAPLRVKSEAVSGCEGERTKAAAIAAQRQQQLAAAQATCADSVKAFAECESRVRAAEVEVLRWEPEWRLADALDQQVALARVEREKAGKVVADGAVIADKRRIEAEQSRERYLDAQVLHAKTLETLEGRKPHSRLKDEATSIGQWFANRAGLVVRLSGNRQALTAVERDEVASLGRIEESRTAVAARNAERQKLAGQLTERRAALNAIDLDALEIRDEVLRALADKLGKCRDAVQRRDLARAAEARARAEAAMAARQRDEAASKLKIAGQVHTRKSDERAETARMADLAEATLSEHAASLRTHLVEGAPCPVCGADEHPFVAKNSAAAKLARAVRQRRSEIDAALKAAEADILAANATVTKATSASDAAERATAAEAVKAIDAVATLSALLPEVRSEFAGLGLASAFDANPEAVQFAALGSGTTEVIEARKAIAISRDRGRVLRRECSELQSRLDARVKAIETETAEAQKEAAELSALQAERSRLAATVQAREEQLVQGLAALESVLAHADLTPADVERDAAAAEMRILTLADEYAKLISVRDDLAEKLRRLDLEQKGSEERYQAASHEHGNAVRGAAERARQLEGLVQQRSSLLGGMATEQHRHSVQGEAARARAGLDAARKQKDIAELTLAKLGAEHQSAVALLAQAVERLAESRGAFAEAISGAGFDESDLHALLGVPEKEREKLAAQIERLRKAREAASTAMATRQSDLDGLLVSGPDMTADEISEIRNRLEHHSGVLKELQDRLAIIASDLARDRDKQKAAAGIGEKIATQKSDLAVWREIDAAIGQKDGAKFRRFAQGFTLGQLIALANIQLKALNPRYALRRGASSDLALDVIDRDMGDEVRSPRSLSGGERFLVSLALALALSGLEGRQSFVDTLFIDEGFGSLDRDTLDIAIDALESLQGQGRKVGVITHVPAMIERIAVQVRVEKRGGGRSVVRVRDWVTAA